MDKIKVLREKTMAGIMDCKKALAEANNDMDKAVEILRKKGIALASKKASRATNEGVISSYIHTNNKIGVMVEVNCETDFVAKNDLFKAFVRDLAMQIAASHPKFVDSADVPESVLEKEKEIIKEQHKGKPQQAMEKIIAGSIDKFYKEACLMCQPFIKDPAKTIKDLLTELIAKTGENITIRRFVRYQVGEEL